MWWILACAPSQTTPAATPETTTQVMETLSFGRRDGDVGWGFDLDHEVSDQNDAAGCNRPDLTDPDGNPGIDSAFSSLVPAL